MYDLNQILKNRVNDILIFKIVSDFKSIKKASQMLRVSQPSLSVKIRKLEEDLNLELLKRNHQGVELTENGKVIYNLSTNITKLIDDAPNILKTDH